MTYIQQADTDQGQAGLQWHTHCTTTGETGPKQIKLQDRCPSDFTLSHLAYCPVQERGKILLISAKLSLAVMEFPANVYKKQGRVLGETLQKQTGVALGAKVC